MSHDHDHTHHHGLVEELQEGLDGLYQDLLVGRVSTDMARQGFMETRDLIVEHLGHTEGRERAELLWLLCDTRMLLGEVEALQADAMALAEQFEETEDGPGLEELLEAMLIQWRVPDAAEVLLDRFRGELDPMEVEELETEIANTRVEITDSPLTTSQIQELRTHIMGQGLIKVDEATGRFHVRPEGEEDPFEYTVAWLEGQGLDPEPVVKFLEDVLGMEGDLDVLVTSFAPTVYDMLRYWPLEAMINLYTTEGVDLVEPSPDGHHVALFQDDGATGYLYVFDESDETALPPLWIYNRDPAPEGDAITPGPGSSNAPLMPEAYAAGAEPRDVPPQTLLLHWASPTRVELYLGGELSGVADLSLGAGFSKDITREGPLGRPLAELPKDD